GKTVSRQSKRLVQRQTMTGQDRAEALRERRAVTLAERKRTPPWLFVKQVRQELKRVARPSRQVMIAYTVVVLVAVVFLTALVFGMDLAFTKAVLHIFGQG